MPKLHPLEHRRGYTHRTELMWDVNSMIVYRESTYIFLYKHCQLTGSDALTLSLIKKILWVFLAFK